MKRQQHDSGEIRHRIARGATWINRWYAGTARIRNGSITLVAGDRAGSIKLYRFVLFSDGSSLTLFEARELQEIEVLDKAIPILPVEQHYARILESLNMGELTRH